MRFREIRKANRRSWMMNKILLLMIHSLSLIYYKNVDLKIHLVSHQFYEIRNIPRFGPNPWTIDANLLRTLDRFTGVINSTAVYRSWNGEPLGHTPTRKTKSIISE